eukprot:COSAG02_NODE_7684_length_2895_cov_7.093705_2_plen_80_part_00
MTDTRVCHRVTGAGTRIIKSPCHMYPSWQRRCEVSLSWHIGNSEILVALGHLLREPKQSSSDTGMPGVSSAYVAGSATM